MPWLRSIEKGESIMNAMKKIISFIHTLRYEDLPREAIDLIRQDFLDFCGNTLAGSNDPAVDRTLSLFSEWGGKPECTVFVHGTKMPSINAALVNASMAFSMDFDDTHIPAGHVGVTVFPAALAVGEIVNGVSGKEFITAIAGGMELYCRLGRYNEPRVPRHIFGGWDYQELHGSFSSAATAGLLLGLTEDQLMNAMGLAHHQAGGTGLAALEHADSKILGPGFGVRNGMTSAFLAQKGLTGAHHVLEGDYGIGKLVHNGCDLEGIAANLGEHYELLNVGFKPYASCRLGHRTLDAVSRIIKEHNIKAEDVERVEVRASERVIEQLYEPTGATKNPAHRTAAVFSMPWVVSSMLHRRKVGVSELSSEALADASIRELAQKVFAEVDRNVEPGDHAAPMPITIYTKNGKFSAKTNPVGPGDRGNRIPQDELEAKFYDNAAYCIKPYSPEKLHELVDKVNNLEKIANMDELVALIS